MQAHLRSRLARLLISLGLLFGTDDLATLGIALDWGRTLIAFRRIRLLEGGLHVPSEGQLPYERQEPFPAEDRAEDLLGVDEATLGRALLGSKFVVLVPELGVGKRLVRDGDQFETLFRVWIVAVLVGVVLDREATCARAGIVSRLIMKGITCLRTIGFLDVICGCVYWHTEQIIIPCLQRTFLGPNLPPSSWWWRRRLSVRLGG